MKKSSHFIEETQIDVGDSRTVLYGSYLGVLRITVRGMFTPTVPGTRTEYTPIAIKASDGITKAVRKKLYSIPEVGDYSIVETDMSATGLKLGVPAKIRYTFFVHQTDSAADRGELTAMLVRELIPVVDEVLESHGFKWVDAPEPDTSSHKIKK